jgi:hypothetical protein
VREIRLHGSEGGEAKAFPTPISHHNKGARNKEEKEARLNQNWRAEEDLIEPDPNGANLSGMSCNIGELRWHPDCNRLKNQGPLSGPSRMLIGRAAFQPSLSGPKLLLSHCFHIVTSLS